MFHNKKEKGFNVPVDSQGDLRIPERSPFSNINSIHQETADRGSRLSDCIGPTHNWFSKKEKKEK